MERGGGDNIVYMGWEGLMEMEGRVVRKEEGGGGRGELIAR